MNRKAAYLETGTWAVNAIKEAKLFGEVDVVASSKEANFSYIPKGYTVPDDVDYFHFTSNNTIYGTEMRFEVFCYKNLQNDGYLLVRDGISTDYLYRSFLSLFR